MEGRQLIISASHVSKQFGSQMALNDVSLSIPHGEIYGLLGPNGAGKTTLIRIITQITGPDSGQLTYFDQSLNLNPMRFIGYLPEERGLYRKMKVWEQALYLTMLKGLSKKEAQISLTDWFKRLEMTEWINKRVEDLSKGMQQKLQFVITVAHNPKLLILDEPFSGFDPINAEIIKKEIINLRDSGTSVIFSTHNMSSVEELCESIALINRGEKVIEGSVREIRNSFKKNIFEIEFKGPTLAFANALGHRFELIALHEGKAFTKASVKAHDMATGNQLLQQMINAIEVLSFSEKVPGMNDIFLDLVSSNLPSKSDND
jgi:ABC-2 type transport system ATP-binding protein